MTLRRFLATHPPDDGVLRLDGTETHHMRDVIRLKPGDAVEVVNGAGDLYQGEILALERNEGLVKTRNHHHEDQPACSLVICPPLLASRLMNDLVEKLCEMGVDEIRPVCFDRSEVAARPGHPAKWRKIALQTVKQNRRLWATRIYEPVALAEILSRTTTMPTRLILDPASRDSQPPGLKKPAACLIGPPGDFTEREREAAIGAGYKPLRINDVVLRSETAAISAAAILKNRREPL